jgi:hypothetical protein
LLQVFADQLKTFLPVGTSDGGAAPAEAAADAPGSKKDD